MPMKVRCSKCNKVIYESKELLTPDEIISKFDGHCPHCGHKLGHFPSDVKISPVEKRA
jgi:DNA-directed RNA polymerase subunit RPC12/RpoP